MMNTRLVVQVHRACDKGRERRTENMSDIDNTKAIHCSGGTFGVLELHGEKTIELVSLSVG